MVAALRIEHLRKTYRKGWRRQPVAAVSDVSLEMESGEAFGFVGPNGAGKTSTIRILMGLAEATSGTVELFGRDAGRPESRRGVGYVPENPYLYDHLTPLEILEMGMRLHGVREDGPTAYCMRWLERLDLAAVARSPIRAFSKGMTQRVAIAQALCIRPRMLVLDEPLSGLDPVGRHDVVNLLFDYKSQGGTLFFTSHVLHDVERLADRFGLIHEGRLRSVRSPVELASGQEVFLVRSSGAVPVEGMTEETAGRWAGEVPHGDLWPRLEQIRAAGHSLLEIRPALNLESAFMRAIGKE